MQDDFGENNTKSIPLTLDSPDHLEQQKPIDKKVSFSQPLGPHSQPVQYQTKSGRQTRRPLRFQD